MIRHIIKFMMLVVAGFFLYLAIEMSDDYYFQDITLMTETIVVTPYNKEE